MRNKFFELIEKGVAPFSYKNVVSNNPELSDDFIRNYNNIYSLVSDTHADLAPEDLITEYPDHKWLYIITGSLVGRNEQRWEMFCCDPRTWAGDFNSRAAGFYSPAHMFSMCNLAGEKLVVNGDVVYGLYSTAEEAETGGDVKTVAPTPVDAVDQVTSQNTLGYEPTKRVVASVTALEQLASYTTTESGIPHPLSELSVNVRTKDVKDCVRGAETLNDVVEALNNSTDVLGENWIVFENKIVGYIGNKTIYL